MLLTVTKIILSSMLESIGTPVSRADLFLPFYGVVEPKTFGALVNLLIQTGFITRQDDGLMLTVEGIAKAIVAAYDLENMETP